MDLKEFGKKGYCVRRGYFPLDDMRCYEHAIMNLYKAQARKIAKYRDKIYDGIHLSAICEMMEDDDKEALYQVQKMMPSSRVDGYLGFGQFMGETTLMEGPGLLINRPQTNRLLYKWHSEEHYYPKRRNFVNAWWPLFGDKTKENGTMSFKVGSHKKHYPFAEYQGYRQGDDKKNAFLQYEIPENFVEEFKEVYVEAKRGDLVLFHSNLVHRSNANASDSYSFAGVARLWDPSDDLTLSGTFAATPYGNDVGRPDLVVHA